MKPVTQGQHSFAKIPSAEIQRSVFDRSCGLKTTFDAGLLIPIFCDEALPGDTMSLRMHSFGRLATPLHPILDNMTLTSFFFSVPMRLLWDNWAKFNGEQDNPGDSTDFTIPIIDTGVAGIANSSLSHYIGIPEDVPDMEHSAMWHRAYNLVFNEWFRDENLTTSVDTDTSNGPDTTNYVLLRRGKRHDYFTSCLPFPQKGPAVTIPIGDSAPVVSEGTGIPTFDVGTSINRNLEGEGAGTSTRWNLNTDVADAKWNDPHLEVDLSGATAQTINSLRQAFQIQRLYERDARGGSRYTEVIRSHFGVTSPDQRLQRPEYLGGGTQTINITPVPQQSEAGTTPQGNLAGYGTTQGSGHSFQKSFVEHCIIIGMVSVNADLTYQRGLERQFSRSTRWDFFWPALAHLGEQTVLNREIYAQGSDDPGKDELVFGYQERYAEYRYKPSRITGLMTSNHGASLDTWHLSQDFGMLPLLNAFFVVDLPPIDRIIAVPSEPHLLFDAYFEFKHARPMPTYSVPGLIDHF